MSITARPLHLTDLPLLALHGRAVHPNQAVTFEACDRPGRSRPRLGRLLRAGLLGLGRRRVWVTRAGSSLLAAAALRHRGGPGAWEIDYLVATTTTEVFLLDLLDRVVATAGAEGAHRLFLRLGETSPILPTARRHGFAEVTRETLYAGTPPPLAAGDAASDGPARRRRRADDHDLFQLFRVAVPQEVRWLTALSPSEWRAAQEPVEGAREEWVIDPAPTTAAPNPTGLAALVRLSLGARGVSALLLASGEPAAATAAVALALARSAGRPRLQLLVPDHALAEARAAQAAGLSAGARYVLLVRPIAQRAQRLQLTERAVEGSARSVIR